MGLKIRKGSLDPSPNPLKPAIADKSRRRRDQLKAAHRAQTFAPAVPRNDLRPPLRFVELAPDELKLPTRKVRHSGPKEIEEVINSIRQYGFSRPVLIGKDNEVIDGVVTVEAARALGLATISCIGADHLNASERRALRLALNRIGATRPYDAQQLKLEFTELLELGQPIEILGFSSIELDIVLAEEPVPEERGEGEDDPQWPAVTEPGMLWQLGAHRLLCGDAKTTDDYARLLGEEKVQLALTDPPYGVAVGKVVSTKHRDFIEGGGDMDQAAFENLITTSFQNISASLAAGGMLLSFMDYKHVADVVVIGKALGYEHLNLIIWVKPQAGMGSLWRSQSEFVVALKRPGKHKNRVGLGEHGRDRSNVWQVAGAGSRGSDARAMLANHPTPKPVEMLIDAIFDVTDRGDIVLDPFGGSGSTLIACERAARKARLMEKDPLYCDLAVRRWEQETGQQAIEVATGRTFAETEQEKAGTGWQDDPMNDVDKLHDGTGNAPAPHAR